MAMTTIHQQQEISSLICYRLFAMCLHTHTPVTRLLLRKLDFVLNFSAGTMQYITWIILQCGSYTLHNSSGNFFVGSFPY